MKRKIILLCAALSLAMSPMMVEAASITSSKHKVSSRKIIRTIRADQRYRLQKTTYRPSVFKDTYDGIGLPQLASSKALIVNQETGETLYAKSIDLPTPIASVTKLMTAMVMLDAHLPMDEVLRVSDADVDMLKGT